MSEIDANNKTPDPRMIDDYFEYQSYYTKIYGENAIVFMQNGKFYESYDTEFEGFDLRKIQEILQIRFAKRGKNSNKTDPRSKARMLGFPTVNLCNSLNRLTKHGYTVIIFEEKPNTEAKSKNKFERHVTGIYSPGTYISDKQIDSNYLLIVYMVAEPQLKKIILSKNLSNDLLAIGITLLDITTGNSIIYEFYSEPNDENFGLDELLRIIQGFRPAETIIYFKPNKSNKISETYNTVDNIKSYLELDKMAHYFYIYDGVDQTGLVEPIVPNGLTTDLSKLLTPNLFKINYQNDYLASIFKLNNQVNLNRKTSPVELLNLENKPYVLISLILMLRYINEHNKNLLKNLSYPTFYSYSKHLILGNNAIQQLNVIDSNNLESYNKKIESLYDVVNKTTTPMGRRFLKYSLTNPLSQEEKKIIHMRYNIIDELLNNRLFEQIHAELKNIYDLERYHRQMARGRITPYEFYCMDHYYKATIRIINSIKDNSTISKMLSESLITKFIEYQNEYSQTYNIDLMQNYNNFADITESIFNIGFNTKIDKLVNKIKRSKSILVTVKQLLSDMITINQSDKEIVKLESSDKNYCFTVTRTHEKLLKAYLAKKKKTYIWVDLDVDERLKILKSDIIFKQTKSRTKITILSLDDYVSDLDESEEKLRKLTEKIFIQTVLELYTNHHQILHKITNFIAEIDFLVSGAIVADQYYYCRPKIELSQNNAPSYIKTKQLRHPIIERLCKEIPYVPNDIELGSLDNKNGIMLYGINSCGKSSLMKSIGLAIILAQIGYYVPAEEFIYEPYLAIYARITGNDNLFKGQSSFVVEMTELDAILKRTAQSGPNILVIGDEVCRGTNETDAQSLVVSTLVRLSEFNATYIFSSHLHNLPFDPEIQALKNLRMYHLLVEHNIEADCLVFDRRLVPGSGPRSYALIVAKYIIRDPRFINMAETIKQRLTGELATIPIKRSKYNKLLLVKMCAICTYRPILSYHKELETHHIKFQSKCLPDGKIIDQKHLNKNDLHNLVILCRQCHESVHKNEIIINGYIDTSKGPMLDYQIDIQSKINNDFALIEQFDQFDKCNGKHSYKNSRLFI